MKFFLKVLLILGVISVGTVLFFTLYSRFLVDYSLENLQFAIDAAEKKDPSEVSPLVNSLYSSLVQDQAFAELTQDKVNVNNLTLMDMVSHSFEDGSYRNGYARAKLYLEQVFQGKTQLRNPTFQFLDSAHQKIMMAWKGFARYLRVRFAKKQEASAGDFAKDILLNQAQEFEKKNDWDNAAALYRKHLSLNKKNPNRGFVSVALANVLIRQGRQEEAENQLHTVAVEYAGLEEADLANRFLKKIDFLKQGNALIPALKNLMAMAKDTPAQEDLRLKLALAHISLYQLNRAEELLKAGIQSKNPSMSTKSKFYLGWLYKLRHQYGEGEKILLDLLDDPGLARDLELGLHAQLADIYTQEQAPEKALEQYAAINKKSKEEVKGPEASKKQAALARKAEEEAWSALSDLEQSNIYYFDVKDAKQAGEHLNAAGKSLGIDAEELAVLQKDFQTAPFKNLLIQAFSALEKQQISLAYDLFLKNSKSYPNDAWTYGGLATIYVLFGDMPLALENAERAYQLATSDEYTASTLGYVYALSGKFKEAAPLYRQALQINGSYFPAKFNLAYVYLMLEDFGPALELLNKIEGSGKMNPVIQAKVRNNIGYALWKTDKHEEARKKFREALQINPDLLVAKKNLSFSAGGVPEAAMLTDKG